MNGVSRTTTATGRGGDDALRQRARRLGVEPSFIDVDGVTRHAPMSTLRSVVDVLEADRGRAAGPIEPVVVIGGPDGRGRGASVAVGGEVAPGDAHLSVEGTGIELDVTVQAEAASGASSMAPTSTAASSEASARWRVVLPDDLPIGCHELRISLAGDEHRVAVIVAPDTMAVASAARRSGVFTPLYGLWEPDRPRPAFSHLADMAAGLGRRGVDTLLTLPLYDAFLEPGTEPGAIVEPSPYSPASRLHWNEIYLDDGALGEVADTEIVAEDGGLDWPALAARRRAQLVAAAADLDGETAQTVVDFVARRPDVGAYAKFRAARDRWCDAPEVTRRRSYELAQYLAHRQLAAVAGSDGAQPVATLGLDLPIGSHPSGYETTVHRDLFAVGFRVGAPPDDLFRGGQDWGFPPPLPAASRRSGHELWRRTLERAAEHAGMLRIDHVMAAHRLWWIPPDADSSAGVYVRYPADEIFAVIAAVCIPRGVTVVGEDLGTVPPEVTTAMRRWSMLGMHEAQFHLDDDDPPEPDATVVAGIRTHDMAAFSQACHGSDPRAELDRLLIALSASDAAMVVLDLDDALGLTGSHNRPGRVGGLNWRRRLPVPGHVALGVGDVARRIGLIATRGSR